MFLFHHNNMFSTPGTYRVPPANPCTHTGVIAPKEFATEVEVKPDTKEGPLAASW
jgi:hypothetical protein